MTHREKPGTNFALSITCNLYRYDEAALFAQDLLRMYELYARRQGWRFELLSTSFTENGGYKEASASVVGLCMLNQVDP